MPPGFWELYDGASSAGVTVHFVDDGLDTGDIVATSEIPILKTDTPDTLSEKLHDQGTRLLVSAVSMIRDGSAAPETQQEPSIKPRTKPTRAEADLLHQRLSCWPKESTLSAIWRNIYLLFIYYSGIYFVSRQLHLLSRSRAVIFLHHRVNDYSKDVLTVDPETLAAQLLAISKRYSFATTSYLVECVRDKRRIRPTTVAIHFDDCYRDILLNGLPILRAAGISACAFINSGFVNTDRAYPHDLEKYPFQYPKLRSSDLIEWSNQGFEVGAHTVNHADLGNCPIDTADFEIRHCGQDLREMLGKPIVLFSFPFGRTDNIRPETRDIVETSGYKALFSAYGGFINAQTGPFDIPRIGASHECSPLYCLLAIEGLTLSQLLGSIKGMLLRSNG
jgi:peptidoglycan/xylan/chitin deacetylase (PgdA/CDA1 family)